MFDVAGGFGDAVEEREFGAGAVGRGRFQAPLREKVSSSCDIVLMDVNTHVGSVILVDFVGCVVKYDVVLMEEDDEDEEMLVLYLVASS